jgi:hypothetical protein
MYISYLNHLRRKTIQNGLHFDLDVYVLLLDFSIGLRLTFLEHISEAAVFLRLEDSRYLVIHFLEAALHRQY